MKRFIVFFLAVLIIYIPKFADAQGYNIKFKIKDLKNTDLYLGHYLADSKNTIVDDTVQIDANGNGITKGKDALPGGMYFIYFNKHLFNLIIDKEQNFSIDSDTTDFIANAKFTGSRENTIHFEYLKYIGEQNKKAEALRERHAKGDEAEKKAVDMEFRKLNETVLAHIDKTIADNKGLFFSVYLNGTREIKIPDAPVDDKGNVIDKQFQYRYYRTHFFDNFDYKDPRLLRTPFYQGKIDEYLKILPPMPDSLKPEIDKLINNARVNEEMFRFMLTYIHNYFVSSQIMGMDAMSVYIADKYYIPEATWSSADYLDKMKDMVKKRKPNLIGNRAPDLRMQTLPKNEASIKALRDKLLEIKPQGEEIQKSTTLSQEQKNRQYVDLFSELSSMIQDSTSLSKLKSEYTIVWFWEPSCSHCRAATPVLAEYYHKFKNRNVEVYAVFLQAFIEEWDKYTKNIEDWYDFVLKNNCYQWVNSWDVYHSTNFRDLYDISSSPVVYVLDKDKKIIAKRIGVVQIFDVLIERMLEKIYTDNPGEAAIPKVKQFVSEDFTLFELESVKAFIDRKFEGKTLEQLQSFINGEIQKEQKLMNTKVDEICKQYADKEKINQLKNYINKFSNEPDLKYLKTYTSQILKDSEKTEIEKHIDFRLEHEIK